MRPVRASSRDRQGLTILRAVILVLLTGTAAVGCGTTQSVTPNPFAQTDRIGAELLRGVSTKTDVERLLGKPNGRGMTLLPTQDRVREMWTYLDLEKSAEKVEREATGVVVHRFDARQRQIYVFFDGEKFDGYMWAISLGAAAGERR